MRKNGISKRFFIQRQIKPSGKLLPLRVVEVQFLKLHLLLHLSNACHHSQSMILLKIIRILDIPTSLNCFLYDGLTILLTSCCPVPFDPASQLLVPDSAFLSSHGNPGLPARFLSP